MMNDNINNLNNLISLANIIGKGVPLYVQGGGGNISLKLDNTVMAIKASGIQLKDMTINKGYSLVNYNFIISMLNNNEINEATFNEEIKKSIINNERPSMELGFHSLLKTYVIHTHALYTNILTCSQEGKSVSKKLFKDSLWIDYVNPGFDLTMAIKNAIEANSIPEVIFLQNHGIIVTSNSYQASLDLHEFVNQTIRDYLQIHSISYEEIDKLKYELNYIINNVLFPDQVIYLNSHKENTVITTAYQETLYAYKFILSNILKCNLTPNFIKKSQAEVLLEMESEKYRQNLLKK